MCGCHWHALCQSQPQGRRSAPPTRALILEKTRRSQRGPKRPPEASPFSSAAFLLANAAAKRRRAMGLPARTVAITRSCMRFHRRGTLVKMVGRRACTSSSSSATSPLHARRAMSGPTSGPYAKKARRRLREALLPAVHAHRPAVVHPAIATEPCSNPRACHTKLGESAAAASLPVEADADAAVSQADDGDALVYVRQRQVGDVPVACDTPASDLGGGRRRGVHLVCHHGPASCRHGPERPPL
jgi:hypothetical protein